MKRHFRRCFLNLRHNGLGASVVKMKNCLMSSLRSSELSPHSRNQNASLASEALPETKRTVQKWDKSDDAYSRDGFKEYWELLEDVQLYQWDMMSGGRDITEYLASFLPEGKMLSNLYGLIIGCAYGENAPAISWAKTAAFRRLTIVDIADGLLKKQEQITRGMNLNHVLDYKCMNLDTESISEQNRYDFIFAGGTVHHIRRLEGLFEEINHALRADGIFAMKEYIGPPLLQFTDKQLRIANRILECLPNYLKVKKDGTIKNKPWKASKEEIIADDPSEAVRSQDIIPVIQNSLEILTCNMTGGTLLNPLLHAIAGNFESGEAERAVLRTIIALERTLIEEGVIPSDYVFLVAKKKS